MPVSATWMLRSVEGFASGEAIDRQQLGALGLPQAGEDRREDALPLCDHLQGFVAVLVVTAADEQLRDLRVGGLLRPCCEPRHARSFRVGFRVCDARVRPRCRDPIVLI